MSDFDQVYGRLHDLIRACISYSFIFNVAVPFNILVCVPELASLNRSPRRQVSSFDANIQIDNIPGSP